MNMGSLNPLQVQTKLDSRLFIFKDGKMFQSPIGTNKTLKFIGGCYVTRSLFQSPIGTNKTRAFNHFIASISKFQSPIGTNKTKKNQHKTRLRYIVSIPYRYKQNSMRNCTMHFFKHSFNPLQVQTKPRHRCGIGSTQVGFNPLQVQTKHICTSSLHREHINRGILVPQKKYNTLSQDKSATIHHLGILYTITINRDILVSYFSRCSIT